MSRSIGLPTDAINDRNGNKLTESRRIQSRWKEYIEDMYDKSSKLSSDEMKLESVGEDSVGPHILKVDLQYIV